MRNIGEIKKDDVFKVLQDVHDPDYRGKSILDLGLVDEKDIKITQRGLEIEYRVTAPLCPFSSAISVMIQYALEKKLDTPVHVRMKSQHVQTKVVNEILENETKRKDLLKKLEAYGILQQCVRI